MSGTGAASLVRDRPPLAGWRLCRSATVSLGASVFGRVYKETIIFNEDSVWTRWPDERNNPHARSTPSPTCGGS